MAAFERLLRGSEEQVATMFAQFRAEPPVDFDRRIDDIGLRLGLNASQLVCGFGFNRNAFSLPRVLNVLGFSSYDAMWSHRNFTFISDVYDGLSIDNILEIYQEVGVDPEPYDYMPDLILSRLSNIEAQIEATINPVLLGSYKLEIRGIYDNGLATREMVEARLTKDYEVLRGLADEIPLIVRSRALSGSQLLELPGVSPEEKRRMLFLDLVSRTDVERRLTAPGIPEVERQILTDALAQPGA
jgi:hypothetical protein